MHCIKMNIWMTKLLIGLLVTAYCIYHSPVYSLHSHLNGNEITTTVPKIVCYKGKIWSKQQFSIETHHALHCNNEPAIQKLKLAQQILIFIVYEKMRTDIKLLKVNWKFETFWWPSNQCYNFRLNLNMLKNWNRVYSCRHDDDDDDDDKMNIRTLLCAKHAAALN